LQALGASASGRPTKVQISCDVGISLKFATETGGGVVLFPDDRQALVRERPLDLGAGDARFDAEQTPAALGLVFVHE
jgi:hypothetical protein